MMTMTVGTVLYCTPPLDFVLCWWCPPRPWRQAASNVLTWRRLTFCSYLAFCSCLTFCSCLAFCSCLTFCSCLAFCSCLTFCSSRRALFHAVVLLACFCVCLHGGNITSQLSVPAVADSGSSLRVKCVVIFYTQQCNVLSFCAQCRCTLCSLHAHLKLT